MQGLEVKRAAFAKADAVCRHFLLLLCRNQGMAGNLSATQAADVNKVEPLTLTRVHAALTDLVMAASDPRIVNLYLAIVSPDPGSEQARTPIATHMQFTALCRIELGLPPLSVPVDRCFPISTGCNVIVMPPVNK